MRVLIDSSVWIDHLRGVRTRETAILDTLLAWLDPELEHGGHEETADLFIGDSSYARFSEASPIRASTQRSRMPCSASRS